MKREFEFKYEEDIDWSKLCLIYHGEQEWVLMFEAPLKMYYLIEKHKKMIPIQLE